MSRTTPGPAAAGPPVATVRPARRVGWVWLIPVAAALFVGALYATYVVKRGPVITITMDEGHGIKAGDVLRCRGIVIGQVEAARVSDDCSEVSVRVRLDPAARAVARAGSRFWVVRPRVSLTSVGGLETITGPRYLAVVPGAGARQTRFAALAEAPIVASADAGGFEVVLEAEQRGSLRPGSPITYRQVIVGTVLAVDLGPDATVVLVRAHIEPAHARLVRADTVFWNVSGADLRLGIKGLSFEVESLQALLDGGVALATPAPPGPPVEAGHRFKLHPRPQSAWLRWRPALPPPATMGPPEPEPGSDASPRAPDPSPTSGEPEPTATRTRRGTAGGASAM